MIIIAFLQNLFNKIVGVGYNTVTDSLKAIADMLRKLLNKKCPDGTYLNGNAIISNTDMTPDSIKNETQTFYNIQNYNTIYNNKTNGVHPKSFIAISLNDSQIMNIYDMFVYHIANNLAGTNTTAKTYNFNLKFKNDYGFTPKIKYYNPKIVEHLSVLAHTTGTSTIEFTISSASFINPITGTSIQLLNDINTHLSTYRCFYLGCSDSSHNTSLLSALTGEHITNFNGYTIVSVDTVAHKVIIDFEDASIADYIASKTLHGLAFVDTETIRAGIDQSKPHKGYLFSAPEDERTYLKVTSIIDLDYIDTDIFPDKDSLERFSISIKWLTFGKVFNTGYITNSSNTLLSSLVMENSENPQFKISNIEFKETHTKALLENININDIDSYVNKTQISYFGSTGWLFQHQRHIAKFIMDNQKELCTENIEYTLTNKYGTEDLNLILSIYNHVFIGVNNYIEKKAVYPYLKYLDFDTSHIGDYYNTPMLLSEYKEKDDTYFFYAKIDNVSNDDYSKMCGNETNKDDVIVLAYTSGNGATPITISSLDSHVSGSRKVTNPHMDIDSCISTYTYDSSSNVLYIKFRVEISESIIESSNKIKNYYFSITKNSTLIKKYSLYKIKRVPGMIFIPGDMTEGLLKDYNDKYNSASQLLNSYGVTIPYKRTQLFYDSSLEPYVSGSTLPIIKAKKTNGMDGLFDIDSLYGKNFICEASAYGGQGFSIKVGVQNISSVFANELDKNTNFKIYIYDNENPDNKFFADDISDVQSFTFDNKAISPVRTDTIYYVEAFFNNNTMNLIAQQCSVGTIIEAQLIINNEIVNTIKSIVYIPPILDITRIDATYTTGNSQLSNTFHYRARKWSTYVKLFDDDCSIIDYSYVGVERKTITQDGTFSLENINVTSILLFGEYLHRANVSHSIGIYTSTIERDDDYCYYYNNCTQAHYLTSMADIKNIALNGTQGELTPMTLTSPIEESKYKLYTLDENIIYNTICPDIIGEYFIDSYHLVNSSPSETIYSLLSTNYKNICPLVMKFKIKTIPPVTNTSNNIKKCGMVCMTEK